MVGLRSAFVWTFNMSGLDPVRAATVVIREAGTQYSANSESRITRRHFFVQYPKGGIGCATASLPSALLARQISLGFVRIEEHPDVA